MTFDADMGRSVFRIRGLDGKVVREFSHEQSTGQWLWEKDWIHREGKLLGTVSRAQGTRHAHLDHLGTPRVFSDSSGIGRERRHYFPFGEEALISGSGVTLGFTGHELDENDSTGTADDLTYMVARYQHPQLGRFLSTDPINSAKAANPISWNKYAYAGNNPIGNLDPDGRAFETFVDAAFIAYDLVDIGRSIFRGEGVSSDQVVTLGLDTVGAVVPFVPGLGRGRKILQAADKGGAGAGTVSNAGKFANLAERGGLANLERAAKGKGTRGVREVQGNADDARSLFNHLTGSNEVVEVKPGVFVAKGKNGGVVTFRETSKSGPPTIDLNQVEEGVRKIKFLEILE